MASCPPMLFYLGIQKTAAVTAAILHITETVKAHFFGSLLLLSRLSSSSSALIRRRVSGEREKWDREGGMVYLAYRRPLSAVGSGVKKETG